MWRADFGCGAQPSMVCVGTKISASLLKRPQCSVTTVATTKDSQFQPLWCFHLFRQILHPRRTRGTLSFTLSTAGRSRLSICWIHLSGTMSKSSWPCTSATASTTQALFATTSAQIMNLSDSRCCSKTSWRNSRSSCSGVGSIWRSKRTKTRSRQSSTNTTRSKWSSCRSRHRRWEEQQVPEAQPTSWLEH